MGGFSAKLMFFLKMFLVAMDDISKIVPKYSM
jgi:hypothetical protein